MRRAVRALWNSSFQAVPLRFVSRLAPSGLLAPCYHLVSDHAPAHVRHLFPCRSIGEFKAELDWLLKRFTPVSLHQLQAHAAAGEPLPPRPMFLSFDDGLRECIEVVAPLCLSKGVPVTFFLPTAFIGNRLLGYRQKASVLVEQEQRLRKKAVRKDQQDGRDFRSSILGVTYRDSAVLDEYARQLDVSFEEYLASERPFMDDSEVEQLIRMGFCIGAHSVDHPLYSSLTLEDQLLQTENSIQTLRMRFGVRLDSFAFPFTADGVTENFVRRILSEGTAQLVFYTGSTRESHRDRVIWRFGVESGDGTLGSSWKKDVGRQQLDRMVGAVKSLIGAGSVTENGPRANVNERL